MSLLLKRSVRNATHQQLLEQTQSPGASLIRRSRTKSGTDEEDQIVKQQIENMVPDMGKRLLMDGMFCEIMETGSYDRMKWLKQYKARHVRHGRDMHELILSMNMISKMNGLLRYHCTRCLYLHERCICNVIDTVDLLPRYQIWLFQTIGEYGRNNNSGTLLCPAVGARRIFRGWAQQEDQLVELCLQSPQSTAVVFPSKQSVTTGEFQKTYSTIPGTAAQPLNLIVLDGTPNDAANMDRFLPQTIQRIRLDDKVPRPSWFNSIREQPGEFRVCTAQAAAVVLNDFGEKKAAQEIEKCVRIAVSNTESDQAKYLPKANNV